MCFKVLTTSACNRSLAAHVRDWARQNGYAMADRGRIPNKVLAAYDGRH
ncbi:hypothetical protein C8250_028830 [Streptomyces sp. So13.3]|nr:histone-like nucleoid-structuring protein Lsr2 [Streptomyces sp. So13.3]QNA75358.1 hypothetical protein C8250_028830 [Streptomyces sp. So13.3]